MTDDSYERLRQEEANIEANRSANYPPASSGGQGRNSSSISQSAATRDPARAAATAEPSGCEPDHLRAFIKESNRIEGIARAPTRNEIDAHRRFLALEAVTVDDLCTFVMRVANRRLRNQPGMNVYVGNHIPPPGGPDVEADIEFIVREANDGRGAYGVHLRYETLHPFMDGNGRSGRALWLWQMLRQDADPWAMRRGFLHTFYYQTLSALSSRSPSPASPESLSVPQDEPRPSLTQTPTTEDASDAEGK